MFLFGISFTYIALQIFLRKIFVYLHFNLRSCQNLLWEAALMKRFYWESVPRLLKKYITSTFNCFSLCNWAEIIISAEKTSAETFKRLRLKSVNWLKLRSAECLPTFMQKNKNRIQKKQQKKTRQKQAIQIICLTFAVPSRKAKQNF